MTFYYFLFLIIGTTLLNTIDRTSANSISKSTTFNDIINNYFDDIIEEKFCSQLEKYKNNDNNFEDIVTLLQNKLSPYLLKQHPNIVDDVTKFIENNFCSQLKKTKQNDDTQRNSIVCPEKEKHSPKIDKTTLSPVQLISEYELCAKTCPRKFLTLVKCVLQCKQIYVQKAFKHLPV